MSMNMNVGVGRSMGRSMGMGSDMGMERFMVMGTAPAHVAVPAVMATQPQLKKVSHKLQRRTRFPQFGCLDILSGVFPSLAILASSVSLCCFRSLTSSASAASRSCCSF